MNISAEKAEEMFNKGCVIWVYDDSGDFFYDEEKTKPVECRFCKLEQSRFDNWIQVKTFGELVRFYSGKGNITHYAITTITGKRI